MKIAIIGAGFAGIAAGKVLRQLGHDITIFEKCPDVGGVWSRTRRYPGLCTQNNKGTYHLSDLPMPSSYPEWPSGKQVQAYMEGYAAMFGLTPHLRLSTEVVSATPNDPAAADQPNRPHLAGGWSVRSRNVETGEETTEDYDFVVVANGIFSEPSIPQWPGREEFEAAGGRVCAPSQVNELDQIRGQHIAIIGYGKSACDVAVSLSDAAASTTVIARQLIWKMPRMVAGALNYKYLMLTRLGESLFEYQNPEGIEKFLHGSGKPATKSMLTSLEKVATAQLKLKKLGLVPDGGFERIARSTVSLVTEGFFEKVDRGELRVVRDASIAELTTRDGLPAARLSTGEVVQLDTVVCATGFTQQVPFLPREIQDEITDERGNFELYRQILPHKVPGLAFCGYNSSFYSPLSAEAAAIWIGAYLIDELEHLPPVEERRRLVAEKLRWMEERTEGHHARGTNIIPFSMHNVDEILSDVGLDVSPAKKAEQWALPVDGRDYQDIPERLLRRHEERTGEKLGLRERDLGLTPKIAQRGTKVARGAK